MSDLDEDTMWKIRRFVQGAPTEELVMVGLAMGEPTAKMHPMGALIAKEARFELWLRPTGAKSSYPSSDDAQQ